MKTRGQALLEFLKEAATIRRLRQSEYSDKDKVIYVSKLPTESPDICSSPFLGEEFPEASDYWWKIQKKPAPPRPAVPKIVEEWVRESALDNPKEEPELLPEITILVEKRVPDPEAPAEEERSIIVQCPEKRYLVDHPEVQEAWLVYLIQDWQPWAERRRRWQAAQQVYDDVDFMRRRLEEAEERYQLLFGIGLLIWRDPQGQTVKRHLLIAPAEIIFEATHGRLTVIPAADFETFRVVLDMLSMQDQPRLDMVKLGELLSEVDVRAWDRPKVAMVLREIANRLAARAQVDEMALEPTGAAGGVPRVVYAPALILRERRLTGFDELVEKFTQISEQAEEVTSAPWERFLDEGRDLPQGGRVNHANPPGRLYFPLPANEDQRQIVQRLMSSPGVVVKGPPGTGKSHTIANLIAHLLANGERILVTAETSKALAVLRGLLPQGLHALCLSALSSSREDQRLLEEGVRRILAEENEWQGQAWADRKIAELENEIDKLEQEMHTVNRQLLECREAETYPHKIAGRYEGTSAAIARRLEKDRETHGWIPGDIPLTPLFPLSPDELYLLADVHTWNTPEIEAEVELDAAPYSLPSAEEFRRELSVLAAAEDAAKRALHNADPEKIERLANFSIESMEKIGEILNRLDNQAMQAQRRLGSLADKIIEDLLTDNLESWRTLHEIAGQVTAEADKAVVQLGRVAISLPLEVPLDRLKGDVDRRLDHFQKGGRRGFLVFQPRVMRETGYVERQCTVNGLPPREPADLARLLAFLDLELAAEKFCHLWPTSLTLQDIPEIKAACLRSLTDGLALLLGLSNDLQDQSFLAFLNHAGVELSSPLIRVAWLSALTAARAQQEAETAREPFLAWAEQLSQTLDLAQAHPVVRELAEALDRRDVAAWQLALTRRADLQSLQAKVKLYHEILPRLDALSPALVQMINEGLGDPIWQTNLLNLEAAWNWGVARTWLTHVSGSGRYEELVHRSHRLREQVERKTGELVEVRSWNAFLARLDDFSRKNLGSWVQAENRIGQGTGRYAYMHRRTARQYLMACIPTIPAWIMPLHKLWDTVGPQPGLFDTIIIDEASQAGLDSLLLILLAKRIIVVGDDKQNSPEDVGIREEDIARLQTKYLGDFHFKSEFRLDTSLFDHALRGFGSLVPLREHFRCVPEIIRFSNERFYQESPLIPLRQAPPNRLLPLKSILVVDGYCEGNNSRIQNRPEAEALVAQVEACLQDKAYDGKSMGIIVLQGQAQAALLERLLSERVDPKVLAERGLRCGTPATFQGDQRDVIFLSLVVAPNYNSRAITTLPFQRRYNVAMSRAKDQVWLFHSMKPEDLSPICLRRQLVIFFQSPWQEAALQIDEERDRLEREALRKPRRPGEQPKPYESWFEVDVALELLRRGYRVRSQYEVAKKRIDLVVEGLKSRLAVECDGEAWHGPERYAEDMDRQRQLGRAGWTFVRIRESEFYLNRKSAIEEVIKSCNELGILPVSFEGEKTTEVFKVEPQAEDQIFENDAEKSEACSPESSDTVQESPTGYSPDMDFPDPRQGATATVRDALRQIIEKDGPLTLASIYRFYAEGCPYIPRATRGVQEMLNRALSVMLQAKEIVLESKSEDGNPERVFVWLAGSLAVTERSVAQKDLSFVSPRKCSCFSTGASLRL